MLTRRDFVEDACGVAAGVTLAGRRLRVGASSVGSAALPPPVALRIGAIDLTNASAPRARARHLGLQLGIDEAQHAAAMFGGSVTLVPLSGTEPPLHGLSALLGGDDPARCERDARRADAAGILYMNIGCADDALRGAGCRRTTFHIAPSDAMYRDALRLAHELAGAAADARAAAWDPSLNRFGADTLNDRFRARFHTGMTADAWTAWFAVKVLWESSLRARSADPVKLAAYLTRDTTQFDGHKGQALSFRAWDHQLRQPVYVLQAGRMVGQQPAAASGDESTRDALDRIGTTAAQSACRLTP
jgi:hypothetical protein